MKRVLVTGGGGLVGRAVMDALRTRGIETHATTRPATGSTPEPGWHPVDLLAPGAPERLIADVRPDTLVHLAWFTEPGAYWTSPLNQSWRAASLTLFKAFLRSGGRRALAAGTSAEYAWTGALPLHETRTPLQPASVYGEEKLRTWREADPLFRAAGAPLAWARFFGPFGPGEDRRRLVPKTCLRLLAGEMLAFDAARDVRDFLHTAEIAAAILAVLNAGFHGPVNVASGEGRTIREVVETIAETMDRRSRVTFGEPESPTPPSVVASADLLSETLGWKPAFGFKDRIATTVAWWRDQVSSGHLS